MPQLFLDRVAKRPDAVALRYKDLGLFIRKSLGGNTDEVEAFAARADFGSAF